MKTLFEVPAFLILVLAVALSGAAPASLRGETAKSASKSDSPATLLRVSAGRYSGDASGSYTRDFTATGGSVLSESYSGRKGSIRMPRGKGRGTCDLSDIGMPLAGKTKITKARVRGKRVVFVGRYSVANASVRASGPISGSMRRLPEARMITFTSRLRGTSDSGALNLTARFRGFKSR